MRMPFGACVLHCRAYKPMRSTQGGYDYFKNVGIGPHAYLFWPFEACVLHWSEQGGYDYFKNVGIGQREYPFWRHFRLQTHCADTRMCSFQWLQGNKYPGEVNNALFGYTGHYFSTFYEKMYRAKKSVKTWGEWAAGVCWKRVIARVFRQFKQGRIMYTNKIELQINCE